MRILLLTNRYVERERWSAPYEKRTLKGMSSDDGVDLLEYLAQEDERLDEIPPERRHDVVKWLGGNPRAIKLLVSSLAYDSLNDLIGLQPELWEMGDQEVSTELVEKLERKILEKTLNQLPDEDLLRLYRLSVHRKPFQNEAIQYLFGEKAEYAQKKAEYAQFKRECIDPFLIERHGSSNSSWFNLHPIAREIGLQKLGQFSKDLQQAHSIVSRYYTHHFKTKQIVGWGALGGYFVESHYHLVKAGQPDDLNNIAPRFQKHIFSTLSASSPIPLNAEELDERIAVLSALLETPGSKSLEYHLACLFQARNQRNDLGRALHHAHRAKTNRNKYAHQWLLAFIQLRLGNLDEAKQALVAHDEQNISLQDVDEATLLNLWDQPSTTLEKYDLAYYFPTLPTVLTGLPYSVTRCVYHPSVLPAYIKSKSSALSRPTQKHESETRSIKIEEIDMQENYVDFDLH